MHMGPKGSRSGLFGNISPKVKEVKVKDKNRLRLFWLFDFFFLCSGGFYLESSMKRILIHVRIGRFDQNRNRFTETRNKEKEKKQTKET